MAFADYANWALNFFIILFVILVILGFLITIVMWYYYKHWRYRAYRCVIFEKDGFGQYSKQYDNAGIFVDKKTGNKRFYMKKAYVGLRPDNVPYIKDSKGVKTVYLMRSGLKNYHFIRINLADDNIKLTVSEEDVNWAINAYERAKKTFSNSTLMQLLPYIALGFVSIVIMVIFIYFFKNFGVLADVAKSFEKAAEHYAAAQSGTTIIPGGG